MRVGIIGLGTVGRAVADLFGAREEIVAWDKSWADPYPEAELRTCDAVVISVSTPEGADGHANLSAVEDAIASAPNDRIILKSTVPPGTTARLSAKFDREICFWPEYVGESRYFNPYFASDLASVPFVILGGPQTVRSWMVDLLLPVMGPTKTYFQCTAAEAELIKYAENCFFATKITFANEFSRICAAFDADWNVVREGWVLDPRVNPMHTAVFTNNPGFGGKCLPKDLSAIIAAARAEGYEAGLLEQVRLSNEEFRK